MSTIFAIAALVSVLATSTLGENQQAWSKHTYNDEPYALQCRSDNYTLLASDTVTWIRYGRADEITADGNYELRTFQGAATGELYVKKVTDDLHGIYICHIKNSNDVHVDSVLQGINVGTRLYRDDMDKYRDGLILGAITGGTTLFLIVAVCLIGHFRYLSEESLEKRRYRKNLRLSGATNGVKNQGYAAEMTEQNTQQQTNGSTENSYVHF